MRRQLTPIALALLLVVTALAAPLGATAAAAETNETRSADLVIEEPSYADGEVAERTENGTALYIAEGDRLDIVPTNVDRANVTASGLETDAGSFSYNEEFDHWVLEPQGETGTFDVYWNVSEPMTVQEGNETVTKTGAVRYEASVRVDGGTNGTYLSAENHQQLQNQADVGEEATSLVDDLKSRWLPFFDTSGSTVDVLERTSSLAATIGNPVNIFQSGYIGFHTFVVLSIGGTLAALQYLGFFAWVVRKLRREKHEFEAAEAAEGELADRQLEVEEKERLQKLANMDWFDIFEDDHVARAFRDHLGETVLDGWTRLNTLVPPENLVTDRVKAMGQAGYVGVVTADQPLADGGEGDDEIEPVVTDVDLVPEADLDEDALADDETVVSLANPNAEGVCDLETLVEVLEWDHDELQSFDFESVDLEHAEFETSIETLDLERLIEELDVQMHHFEDEEEYGRYLHEFVATVREHPFTDDSGSPDDMRYLFNNLLQTAQLLDDRYGYPLAEYQVNAFESALENYDRSARAAAYSEEVSHGAA